MGKTLAKNRKAFHEYEFDEFYHAGIELEGTEIKAVRDGRAKIDEAFAVIQNGEAFVIGLYIGPYENAPENQQHEPDRKRRLLLKKPQIKTLVGKLSREGYSLVPTELYLQRGWAKLELGLGKGLKKHDRREKIKEQETKRRLRQQYDAQIR